MDVSRAIKNASQRLLDAFVDSAFKFSDQPWIPSQVSDCAEVVIVLSSCVVPMLLLLGLCHNLMVLPNINERNGVRECDCRATLRRSRRSEVRLELMRIELKDKCRLIFQRAFT